METAPWVILGRVLHGVPVPDGMRAEEAQDAAAIGGAAQAQEEHATAVDAETGALEEHAAAVDAEADADEEEEHAAAAAAAAYEADLYGPVELPPQVTILSAGRGAHPDGDNPDMYPYIIAAGRFCLLAHFAVAPSYGTCFENNPPSSRLLLVRPFHAGTERRLTASAERVPDRTGLVPGLRNIESVGILFDGVREFIAELQVGAHGGDHATATLVRFREGRWSSRDIRCPLPEVDREWTPHGAVTISISVICWFDLSWGIISCDLGRPDSELLLRFHELPDGHSLTGAAPDGIHTTRCITVTGERRLRYVEITGGADPHGVQAPTVTMWMLVSMLRDGGVWIQNYNVRFDLIWDDVSYRRTTLTRDVPVLALVSPSNHELVCFALREHIFAVNVPSHRVVQLFQPFRLVQMPGPPRPASSRYITAWSLPPELAQALGTTTMDAGEQFETSPVTIVEEETPFLELTLGPSGQSSRVVPVMKRDGLTLLDSSGAKPKLELTLGRVKRHCKYCAEANYTSTRLATHMKKL